MYKCKRIFKDKGILLMSIVSIIALASLGIGMAVSGHSQNQKITKIAALDETQTLAEDKMQNTKTQDANASVKKESETNAEKMTTASVTDTSEKITETAKNTEELTTAPSENTDEAGASVTPMNPAGFTNESIFVWPVETSDIIIDFSMDTTTYFATLDMYKTSDAVCIRSAVDSPVFAGADGVISLHSYNEELGHFIQMDLGNEYEATYGQLKDIQVEEGAAIKKGDLIGYIAEPTKYYTVEGANLYLKLTQNGTPVDPLDYLDYDKP